MNLESTLLRGGRPPWRCVHAAMGCPLGLIEDKWQGWIPWYVGRRDGWSGGPAPGALHKQSPDIEPLFHQWGRDVRFLGDAAWGALPPLASPAGVPVGTLGAPLTACYCRCPNQCAGIPEASASLGGLQPLNGGR